MIAGGACSLPEVMRECGAGTKCGTCRPTIEAMLDAAADGGDEAPVRSSQRRLPMVGEGASP